MEVSQRVKQNVVRAFVGFALLAVGLNVMAAADSFRFGRWSIGLGYLVIAAGLTAGLAVHWYASHRQAPYRWRDESWGQERWRELGSERNDSWDDRGDGDDGYWRDERY